MTPGWVDRPASKEKGRKKSDGHGIGASTSGGGYGQEAVYNNRLYPQLRIMERLGYMIVKARSEHLCCPLEAFVREIYLRFHSK